MIEQATLHADDGRTSFVRYQPYPAIPAKVFGPMPTRMAKGWVLFLNGAEWPTDPSGGGRRTAMRPSGSRLSDR